TGYNGRSNPLCVAYDPIPRTHPAVLWTVQGMLWMRILQRLLGTGCRSRRYHTCGGPGYRGDESDSPTTEPCAAGIVQADRHTPAVRCPGSRFCCEVRQERIPR